MEWLPIAKSLAEHAPVVFTIVAGIIVLSVGANVWVTRMFIQYIRGSETMSRNQEDAELVHRQKVSDSCHQFHRELTEQMTEAIQANTRVLSRVERVLDELEPPHRVRT